MKRIRDGFPFGIRSYLRESHGYLYLPAGNVEPVMNALAQMYTDIHAEVKVQRDGIRKLAVYRLTAKTMRLVFMIYIR